MSEKGLPSSASSSSSSLSHFVKDRHGNPKFIGGAAMQRRNALKNMHRKQATRILRPDQILKSKETLSMKLPPFERYFAGLLRSEASDFVRRKDHDVWAEICQRLALPVPSSPLPPCYSTQKAHFSNRASLVMEESRYAIADGLRRLERMYRDNHMNGKNNHKNSSNNNPRANNIGKNNDSYPETAEFQRDQSMVSMDVLLRSVEHQENTGHSILTFAKENGALTRPEKQSLRNGTVFACLNQKLATTIGNVVLAAVMPQSREEMEQTNSFTVMVFKLVKKTTGEKWRLTSITSLLSDQRKYDACMEQMKNPVPFLFPLLGGKRPTHLRFDGQNDPEHKRSCIDKKEPVQDTTTSEESSSQESSSSSSSSDDSSSDEESAASESSSDTKVVEVIDLVDSDSDSGDEVEVVENGGTENKVKVVNGASSNDVVEVADNFGAGSNVEVLDVAASSDEVEILEKASSGGDVEVVDHSEGAASTDDEVEIIRNDGSTTEVEVSDGMDPSDDVVEDLDTVTSRSDDEVLGTEKPDSDMEVKENVESDNEVEVLEIIDVEATFHLPLLNHSQDAAAKAFLTSKPREITLIQGPPGTGKTTLLTSVIAQYVLESKKLEHSKRQLMVCAPTNKAVSVVCSRFLNTFIDEDCSPCNVILIGDEEKLFDDNFPRGRRSDGSISKLRSVFLYTFIDTICDDYMYIFNTLAKIGSLSIATLSKIKKIAVRLNNRISQNIADKEVNTLSQRIVRLVGEFCDSQSKSVLSDLKDALSLICKLIGQWNQESIWQEILHNADVIFGTLACTGAAFLRKSIGQIEDLIVDEAAAATEPEMYIPFVYAPKRLLAVGDPKQLPATISSQMAEKLGLDKSLHERLMYHCNFDHVMLDTQYRSKPSIMQFPASRFYNEKLLNGGNVIQSGYTNGLTMMGAPPYTMFQVNGTEKQARSGSYQNLKEAMAIVEIVDRFRPSALKKYGGNWCSSDHLRVITFYQAQVALISQLLRKKGLGNVLVATVDSSQGCEADHVIVSFVRSDGPSGRNSVGFLSDERRLNVGMTRAKFQLVCVGNIRRMSTLPEGKADTVRLLALDAIARNCVLPFSPVQTEQCNKRSPSQKRTNDGVRKSNKRKNSSRGFQRRRAKQARNA